MLRYLSLFLYTLALTHAQATPSNGPIVLDTLESLRDNTDACQQPTHEVLAAVVKVKTKDNSMGSGVVIGLNHVLTAAHVVESRSATVEINGQDKEAEVVAIDIKHDLALLSVSTEDLPSIRVSNRTLYERERVWAAGFPLGGDLEVTSGEFQSILNGSYHTSASIDNGSSGGGLLRCFNGQFLLTGMVKAYAAIREGDELRLMRGVSISVPLYQIQLFISKQILQF